MAFGGPQSDLHPDLLRFRYEDFEERRQITLIYFGNSFACLLLLAFGLLAWNTQHHAIAWFALLHALAGVANIAVLRATGNLQLANCGFMVCIFSMFTYLLASGGINHTGPLWAYPIAAATIFLQGARRGLLLIALMYCIALLIFFAPPAATFAVYAPEFKLRFLATFGSLALFVALHEYARAGNQNELLRVSAQLDRLSHTDPLTGLPNRRYMQNRLEAENNRYLRHQHGYSIVYADVDHFKRLNDLCGHQAGDEALQAIACALRTALRQQDEVSRWGGEEFLVLLPETDQMQAVEVAEKLRAAVAAITFRHGDTPLHLTMSFGVHAVQRQGQVETFIACADQKLYRAKQCGRNRIVACLPNEDTAPNDFEDTLPFSVAV